MVHSCPRCGAQCYCNGDIDDSPAMNDDWVWMNCDEDHEGCTSENDEDEN